MLTDKHIIQLLRHGNKQCCANNSRTNKNLKKGANILSLYLINWAEQESHETFTCICIISFIICPWTQQFNFKRKNNLPWKKIKHDPRRQCLALKGHYLPCRNSWVEHFGKPSPCGWTVWTQGNTSLWPPVQYSHKADTQGYAPAPSSSSLEEHPRGLTL